MERDFVKAYQELESKVKEEQVNREVAYRHMTESAAKIVELTGQLANLTIPVVDGQPIVRIDIQTDKLNNLTYVTELVDILETQLEKIDTIGLGMINSLLSDANKQSK